LRPRDARKGWERGSTGCQMQKSSAGKFHGGSEHLDNSCIHEGADP
jgi:hypothetical protein